MNSISNMKGYEDLNMRHANKHLLSILVKTTVAGSLVLGHLYYCDLV